MASAKTQGFALSTLPRSSNIPANAGAVDVKTIYDGVRQGLANLEMVRRAPASMLLADAEMKAKTAEAPLGTRQVLAQTEGIEQQTPLNTALLAEKASPERIAIERKALATKSTRPLTGTPYLLSRMDELRTALAANPTDATLTSAITETQQLLNKASATTPTDPAAAAAAATERAKIAADAGVKREGIKAGAGPKSGTAGLVRLMLDEGYDDETINRVINKESATAPTDPDADRLSRENIASQRSAATVNAARAKFEATKQVGATKAAAALESAENQTKRIDGLVDTAMGKIGILTTGFGAALANLPTTDARSLREDLETIKANLGFNELNAMRQASPTGGALGNVTERELAFLQKTIASLDQYLDGPDLIDRLQQVREDVKSSWGRVRRAYERQYGAQPVGPSVVAPAAPPAVAIPAFATPEEADAAGAAGTIQPGQKITVGGRGATWSP